MSAPEGSFQRVSMLRFESLDVEIHLLPGGLHFIYLKPRDHKSANTFGVHPSYITMYTWTFKMCKLILNEQAHLP
jgi:hypothetical protein